MRRTLLRAYDEEDLPGSAQEPAGQTSGEDRRLQAALDTALDAIVPPAFVVAHNGQVLQANAPARALLAREQGGLIRSLLAAVTGRTRDPLWDVASLGGQGVPLGFLAIRRAPTREVAIAEGLRTAKRRWKLTARQVDVLDLAARGLTNDLIAESLRIGKGTVEFHLSAIFDKAGVSNRVTLIVRMFELD